MFTSLSILGLRGFSKSQTINLAQPNGRLGSGLTILVGANNSGKSTVIEALRTFSSRRPASFPEGRRNHRAGDVVELTLIGPGDNLSTVRSIKAGGSETERLDPEHEATNRIYTLSSRRSFDTYFGKSEMDRDSFLRSQQQPSSRDDRTVNFEGRLFQINKNNAAFNDVLKKIVNPVPDWTIDQHDTGNYYLKFSAQGAFHNSEGLGEGLISLLFIIDALYDSTENDLIAIDEPELSLHPAILRKLAVLLSEYAATRQIVLSTHSPYFCDLRSFTNGAEMARVYIEDKSSTVAHLSNTSREKITGLVKDQNNPHILGLNAREAFFLDDKIILVEGQEDVVFLPIVEESIGITLAGTLFGFGAGGAEKITILCQMLHDLGYKQVVGILDANKKELIPGLEEKFADYLFLNIPADDIRTKEAKIGKPKIIGLLNDANRKLREEYRYDVEALFQRVNEYLK